MRQYLSNKIRKKVEERAGCRCEYCRMHVDDSELSFSIDHIIAIKHGGGDELDNLAFACPHCNQYKGSDLVTFVDDYDNIVLLFNPRKHDWFEHFEAVKGEIIPKTETGKATVKLLQFNTFERLMLRQVLTEIGHYP